MQEVSWPEWWEEKGHLSMAGQHHKVISYDTSLLALTLYFSSDKPISYHVTRITGCCSGTKECHNKVRLHRSSHMGMCFLSGYTAFQVGAQSAVSLNTEAIHVSASTTSGRPMKIQFVSQSLAWESKVHPEWAYSGTSLIPSLIGTPKGQSNVSWLRRCPHFRGQIMQLYMKLASVLIREAYCFCLHYKKCMSNPHLRNPTSYPTL